MTASHDGEDEAFAAALRAAIQHRGLSLDRLRYHLTQRGHELSVATISYWQSGRSRPERASSRAAITALEEILGVPAGELTGKLPVRRRGGTALPPTPAEAAGVYLPYAEDLMDRLDLDLDFGLTQVSVHDRVVVDADRQEASHQVKQLFVANRDGADHFWIYFQADGGSYVKALHNVTVGAREELSDLGVMVAAMHLSRSLAKGESILVEHEVGLLERQPADRLVERAFVRQVRSAHTEVIFDDACLPLSAERYTIVGGTEKVEPVVIVGRSVQALVLDFGPGVYGVRWTW